MPDSNNTLSVGCSYESNAIYLEEIRSELTEIQWKCGYFPELEIENNITRSQRIRDLMRRYYTR